MTTNDKLKAIIEYCEYEKSTFYYGDNIVFLSYDKKSIKVIFSDNRNYRENFTHISINNTSNNPLILSLIDEIYEHIPVKECKHLNKSIGCDTASGMKAIAIYCNDCSTLLSCELEVDKDICPNNHDKKYLKSSDEGTGYCEKCEEESKKQTSKVEYGCNLSIVPDMVKIDNTNDFMKSFDRFMSKQEDHVHIKGLEEKVKKLEEENKKLQGVIDNHYLIFQRLISYKV